MKKKYVIRNKAWFVNDSEPPEIIAGIYGEDDIVIGQFSITWDVNHGLTTPKIEIENDSWWFFCDHNDLFCEIATHNDITQEELVKLLQKHSFVDDTPYERI